MFTKSGRKLVRITIPQKIDLPPSNANIKQNNHLNGNLHGILDELVSRGCTVTAIDPAQTAKRIQNNILPSPTRKKNKPKPDIKPEIAAHNSPISSNNLFKTQRLPEFVKLQKNHGITVSRVCSEPASNQISKDQQSEQDTLVDAPPPDLEPQNHQFDKNSPSAGNNEKTANINIRRIINGTEYVPFTPQSNVVKRDRLIQVSESEVKETFETAIQCDLAEDESPSETSQSDWINEIIEEYEYLEDNNMYECQICGEVCKSHLSIFKHSMTHKESSLLCFYCGRLFPNTSKLLAHEDSAHRNKPNMRKALRCPKLKCLKAFHSKRQLNYHIDKHTSWLNDQRCSKCQRSFTSPLQLICHMNRRNCWR